MNREHRFLSNRPAIFSKFFLKLLLKDSSFRQSYLSNIYKLMLASLLVFLKKKIKVISLTEHIGDVIACEPIVRYIKEGNSQSYIIWIVNKKYKDLVIGNKNIDKVLTVNSLTEWIMIKATISKIIKVIDLHLDQKPCAVYGLSLNNHNSSNISIYNYYSFGNLLRCFSLAGNLEVPDVTPNVYFKAIENFNLPDRYIAIHATSNENSRCWDNDKWNLMVKGLLEIFPDLYIIELGLNSVINIESSHYLNYCNKLSFEENAYVIKKAFFYIGIDSGFAHFANAYKINSAILIGYYRDFKNYMPYSGFFENNTENIIYHNDVLVNLPFPLAFSKISSRIGNLFYS